MARRRPEPADVLDRHGDPVQAGQERPARGDASGRGRRSTAGGSSRSPGRAGSTPARPSCCRSARAPPTSRCASGVPLVPIAINGTSWLRFGGRVRVRSASRSRPSGRPTREARRRRSPRGCWTALHDLVARRPGRSRAPGRIGRWLTELFNDWPEGSAAEAAPRPPPSGSAGHADRRRRALLWHTSAVDRSAQEGPWRATGLSADPRNTATRLARPERRPDRRLGGGADARRRDPPRRRPVVEDFRRAARLDERGFERVFASGGGPPASDRPRPRGPPDGAGDRPATPSCRASTRRSRTAGTGSSSISSRTSRRSSTSEAPGAPRPGEGSGTGRLAGWVRLDPPVPVAPRRARTVAIAAVATGDVPTAVRLGASR